MGSSPPVAREQLSAPKGILAHRQRFPGLLLHPREQCLKQSSDFSAFYFPFLFLFAKGALAKHRAFPQQHAVGCGVCVRDLQQLSAMQPGWRAPDQLPPHQLGPVKSVVERAERGLGNAAQRLPGVWSRFWSPHPAPSPSPSQLTRFSAAKDASLADSSNDSSFQSRAGLEDRGCSHQHGDPRWAGGAKKCPNNKVMRTARGTQQLVGHPVPGARGAFGEAQPPKRSGCWEAGEWVRDGVG